MCDQLKYGVPTLDFIRKKGARLDRGLQLSYADDIALGATNEENLQRAVENRFNLFKQHGMKMSKSKTEVMVMTRKAEVPILNIQVEGERLKQVKEFKYLGDWVQENGELEREIRARIQGYKDTRSVPTKELQVK